MVTCQNCKLQSCPSMRQSAAIPSVPVYVATRRRPRSRRWCRGIIGYGVTLQLPVQPETGRRRVASRRYGLRSMTAEVNRTFQVDLRGVVDLLSHHLYASPRVYVRELLQNAADAITARRAADPAGPGRVFIEPPELTGDGTLRVSDNGIGLTEAQVHELLATIGRSSKRDDLGFARHEFLGQFGIGLLSCFLVADKIRVETRAAGAPTVRWTGYSDGRYTVEAAPDDERAEVGTTVTLVPRYGSEQLLT